MSRITSNIAHELRTPFLGIKALAQGIGQHLPELIHAYDLAIENRFPIEPIQTPAARTAAHEPTRDRNRNRLFEQHHRPAACQILRSDPSRITSSSTSPRKVVSSRHSHRYPFAGEFERDLIRVDLDRDFMIHAPTVLLIHVLFNLLKNAIYYVHKAGQGDLTVTLVTGREMARFDRRRGHRDGDCTAESQEDLRPLLHHNRNRSWVRHWAELLQDGDGRTRWRHHLSIPYSGSYTRFTLTFPRIEHE